jgi:hypothetical protein
MMSPGLPSEVLYVDVFTFWDIQLNGNSGVLNVQFKNGEGLGCGLENDVSMASSLLKRHSLLQTTPIKREETCLKNVLGVEKCRSVPTIQAN